MIDSNNNQSDVGTYLTFEMNEETFAINVSKVLNILEMQKITWVPRARDYMKGVINLRGAVLPVVDLRIKFGLPIKEDSVDTSIIVLSIIKEEEEVLLGSIVDGVREVLEIKDDSIVASPVIGTRYNSELTTGMLQVDDKFITILDIDKVFSINDVVEYKEQSTTETLEK
ncbi:MAG: chemotaxis protein CheW [Bacteroidales bacterium]|nr:chemotaxis protein CheW [Bacteroidales bacterium]